MSKITLLSSGERVEVEDLTPVQVHTAVTYGWMSVSDLQEWWGSAFDKGFNEGLTVPYSDD